MFPAPNFLMPVSGEDMLRLRAVVMPVINASVAEPIGLAADSQLGPVNTIARHQ